MAIVQVSIRLGEMHALVGLGEQGDRRLSFDDAGGWAGVRSAFGAKIHLTVVIPADATLRFELPDWPRSARGLREMLRLTAPLRPRDLAWTEPMQGEAEVVPWVVLVRKDWLERRLALIRSFLNPVALTVVDAEGHQFSYPTLVARRRTALTLLTVAAIIVSAAAFGIWQTTFLPHRKVPAAERKGALPVAPTQSANAPPPVFEFAAVPTPAASNASLKSDLVLIGIAGRLPDDADVLIKTPWGKTTTMRIGDSLLGWKLVLIAADRVVLERGGARDELVLKPLD